MKNNVSIAPPYSLIFISDKTLGESPEQNGDHIRWTDSCVSITCFNEQEGNTRITLGLARDFAFFKTTAFDGEIDTPSREVVVTTAELDVVLRATVPTTRTRVRIWENHPSEPDDITIILG